MTRLVDRLSAVRSAGKKSLVVYLTAGDPSVEVSATAALAAATAGADVLEIGVPFSDPIADGPVIQRAMNRALAAGGGLAATLEVVARVRRHSDVPIVVFGYLNPLLWGGVEQSCGAIAAAGADGLLVVDLPMEEAGALHQAAAERGLAWVSIVAPTTGNERAARVAQQATGFVYLVSMTGVTGGSLQTPERLAGLVAALRRAGDRPVCIGFGIRDAKSAKAAAAVADGVVVGSAVVEALETQGPSGVEKLVQQLRTGLDLGGPA